MASINKRVGKNGEVTYQLVFEVGTDPITGKRQRIYPDNSFLFLFFQNLRKKANALK